MSHRGRAYDARGNVRPADGRWTTDKPPPKPKPDKN